MIFLGKILSDQEYLNKNIFQYEKRLESKVARFIDKTPSFVTYYHIDPVSSTTDGSYNVTEILGNNSPIRFSKIENFPLYGIENIQLSINDDEEGIDTEYDGDAIITPDTIKPLPNDFFVIDYLGVNYLFIVTGINYDTIKSNNYYNITFSLRASSATDGYNIIEKQVNGEYNCIFNNIGTEESSIIKKQDVFKLNAINKILENMTKMYKIIFYNSKYNVFLVRDTDGTYKYDKYISHFINAHSILNTSDDYNTIYLSNEDPSDRFLYEYTNSIYTNIEDINIDTLRYQHYIPNPITDPNSIFLQYNTEGISSIMLLSDGGTEYLSDSLIQMIKNNMIPDGINILDLYLIRYMNQTIVSLDDINVKSISSYIISDTLHDLIMIPVFIYIMRYYCAKFILMKETLD